MGPDTQAEKRNNTLLHEYQFDASPENRKELCGGGGTSTHASVTPSHKTAFIKVTQASCFKNHSGYFNPTRVGLLVEPLPGGR